MLSVIFFASCDQDNYENQIKEQINQANYCNSEEDCVYVGSKCPFGCYIYVNEAEANRITKLIDEFDSKCVYGCVQSYGAECKNNKCVEILEDPSLNDD